jgi:SNF2 family DNA or RNA helicase
MGLGKTIEAIGGAMLRNELSKAKGQIPLPTLIIAPNDAVLEQWFDALLKNGVSDKRIVMFSKAQVDGLQGDNFILMTRYTAQAEIKDLFENLDVGSPKRTTSALFPGVGPTTLLALHNQYLSSKGKERNRYINKDEDIEDCVSRLLKKTGRHTNAVFETIIIDEAHLLKNRCTFWTMAVALMCIHSSRRVPLTGTPYNNGPGDMATLMTFIDERLKSARKPWWKKAARSGAHENAVSSARSLPTMPWYLSARVLNFSCSSLAIPNHRMA